MTTFELNKTYKDGYGNEFQIIYINHDPEITYPIVAIDLATGTPYTFRRNGIHHHSPDPTSNLIPATNYPKPGEIWTEVGHPNNLYHIYKSPETGSLLAVNTEHFDLFVLDADNPRRSRGGGLVLDTRHK